MNAPERRSRLVAAAAALAGLALVAGACGGDEPAPTQPNAVGGTGGEIVQVSAAEGVAARAERDAVLGRADAPLGSYGESAGLSVASDTAIPVEGDCGIGGQPYVPSAEEIAAANADTDALAAVLDTYGIAHQRVVDDLGFAYVETDDADVVAQSVLDSFWQDRYPPEPIDPAELDRVRAENDQIAAALDAAGVDYTRQSDEAGWEWIEWDYEDPAAQEAVEAVYAELYPPVPPTPDELAMIRTENDRIADAFDAAGVGYTRVADDAGWEWIEWDYEDPAAREAAQQVFDELYPPMPLPEPLPCEVVEPGLIDPAEGDVAAGGGEAPPTASVPVDPVTTEAIDEPVPMGAVADDSTRELSVGPGVVESGFTPRQIRRRDAEVAAMDTGFTDAGVDHQVWGESPWASVTFDIDDPAAVDVIAGVLAARR